MGLITYEQIEDGFSATANLWNSRFSKIYDLVNGNLDAQNLKNSAVTEPKIASEAVTASKIGPGAVIPSKVGNTWVGRSEKRDGATPVGTSWTTLFNKTITLAEAAYIYVLWTANGNANKTGDPGVKILVNDVAVEDYSGVRGLELFSNHLNDNFPFAVSAITSEKQSGNVNIKVQAIHTQSAGFDLDAGFVRIDALSDGTYLGE